MLKSLPAEAVRWQRAKVCIVVLFIRPKDHKEPKCPLIRFRWNKLWNVQAIKYYVATESYMHQTMIYLRRIFKRKKLIGYSLCEKYKHMCVCVRAHTHLWYFKKDTHTHSIFLRGERVWGTGVREVHKGEGAHYNLPTLRPAGTAPHRNL